jgi:hypothetical protein
MRLDFNVLWVDDQPGLVADQITAIRLGMQEEGFEFRPVQCQSLGETRRFLADNVFNDEIDLVLVDWTLGEGVQGQDAIAAIRESIRYKDVVFYSGNNDVDELRRLAFDAGLEGVYCATRPVLVDEVLGVFESLVKKVLDLDHTRGIVMGATSDIDQLVLESISALHAKLGQPAQVSMVAGALEIIEKRMNEHAAALVKLKGDSNLATLVEAHMLFTANDRLRMLSRALQLESLKPHAGLRVHVAKYMDEVVPKRNRLGHRILSPEGRPTGIALGAGEVITAEEMRELRKLILSLRGEFRGLRDALSS